MKILWLCSWYPNKLKPFEGDFIQRHAKAVSLRYPVHVLFIKKDVEGIITTGVKEETVVNNNLTETIIYYKPSQTRIGLINKFISDRLYKKLLKNKLLNCIAQQGKPSFVHVHVTVKAGIAALWLKEKFGIPYILSEHWSGFLPEAYYGIKNISASNRSRTKKIIRNAEKLIVVSNVLGDAIAKKFSVKTFSVIPNVIDDTIFYPGIVLEQSITRFIHASSLNFEKNFEDTITAFSIVKEKGYSFHLDVYGPIRIKLIGMCADKDLEQDIHFKDEVSQAMLAEEMRNSDALVLFSRYETFGCVVIEANACGLPVILSNLPVFKEYVIENRTGILASANSPESLADAIIFFINNRSAFDKQQIAEYAKANFKYEVAARSFGAVYKSML
jgi:glycosyltransferase involved in cell wall biosynthesis